MHTGMSALADTKVFVIDSNPCTVVNSNLCLGKSQKANKNICVPENNTQIIHFITGNIDVNTICMKEYTHYACGQARDKIVLMGKISVKCE